MQHVLILLSQVILILNVNNTSIKTSDHSTLGFDKINILFCETEKIRTQISISPGSLVLALASIHLPTSILISSRRAAK